MIVRREADHAREIYFLLGQIVFEREQTLLVRQSLHLAAVGVHFGDEPLLDLLLALIVSGICAIELRFFRSHSRFRRNRLQVGAADGEHDQFARVLRGIAICIRDIARRAVVVDRREIEKQSAKDAREDRCS